MLLLPRVAIVVGHTKKSPGAVAVKPLSMTEYDYNTDFAQLILTILQKSYNCAAFFRDGLTIQETYQHIEKWSPAVSIELHFNSSSNPQAFGTEVLCAVWNAAPASIFQENLCIALNRDKDGDRGVKILRDDMHRGWASVTNLPCPILIEPFFGSNPEDCKLAMDRQEAMALAILESLKECLSPSGFLRQDLR